MIEREKEARRVMRILRNRRWREWFKTKRGKRAIVMEMRMTLGDRKTKEIIKRASCG